VQPGHMELFRSVFGCPVLKHYGHSERVLMAASMPDDERYYFWPQYGWVELLDFDDRPVRKPGVLGQVVGTSFDNRVMPFVRYRTGDLGVLSGASHPRLPGYPACERIEGRLQEFLVDRQQRLVSLSTISAAHFPWFCQVDSLQYEQERPGELVLKFVADDDFTTDRQHRMADAVARTTGCEVRLARLPRTERTAGGKHRVLVQKLDLARYIGAAQVV
jgi:phenylacetate-CoA ligase